MQFPPLRIFALALSVALGLAACAASTKIVNQWVSRLHLASLQEDHGDRSQQTSEHPPDV
jgi:hypothetical protein